LQDWTHNLSLLETVAVEKKRSSKTLEWQRLPEKNSVNSIGQKTPPHTLKRICVLAENAPQLQLEK